jgi:tetratricopeptide (TPR) repeat protein
MSRLLGAGSFAIVSAVALAARFGGGAINVSVLAARAPQPSALQHLTSEQRERMQRVLPRWVAAVNAHAPGAVDAPAREISTWSGSDLELVLRCITLVFAGDGCYRFAPAKGELAPAVERGALLHADIALLLPPDPSHVPSPLPSSRTVQIIVQFSDARQNTAWYAGVHLEVGRALLDLLRRTEWRNDNLAALWYRATTVTLLRSVDLADADPHLEHAVQVLDHDASLLFYAGVLHEEYASERWQRMLDAARLPSGFTTPVGSEQSELRQAEKFLTRSVIVDPSASEVRLHRARVWGLLGRHNEAAAELRQVANESSNPVLLYYAWLFVGAEEEALGHRGAASDAFERAAALFPSAQSPIIALSELARRYRDRAGAITALRRLFALPSDAAQRVDPWWQYFRAHTGNADLLVGILRSLFRRDTQ